MGCAPSHAAREPLFMNWLFRFHHVTEIVGIGGFFAGIFLKPHLYAKELRHAELDSRSAACLPVLLEIDVPAAGKQQNVPYHVHPVRARRFQSQHDGIYGSKPHSGYFAVGLLEVLVCLQIRQPADFPGVIAFHVLLCHVFFLKWAPHGCGTQNLQTPFFTQHVIVVAWQM